MIHSKTVNLKQELGTLGTRFYATVPTLSVRLGCMPRLPLHQQRQNHDPPTGPVTLMTVPTSCPAVPGPGVHALQASGPMTSATRMHAKTASAPAAPEPPPADRPSDTNDSANRPCGSQSTRASSRWTHGPRNSDARQDSICTRRARTTARRPAQRLTLVSTTGPAEYA